MKMNRSAYQVFTVFFVRHLVAVQVNSVIGVGDRIASYDVLIKLAGSPARTGGGLEVALIDKLGIGLTRPGLRS